MQDSKLKAVIVEDNDVIRNNLTRILESLDRVEVVASFFDGTRLLETFHDYSPDVVFLDIKMDDIDGLTVAARLREANPEVFLVFVTAHTEYAATAYQLDAVDYLIKPVTREAMERAVNRIEKRIGHKANHSDTEKILTIKNKHEMYLIHNNEIIYIEKQLRKTRIITHNLVYETNEPLNALVERLPHNFFRCHKSFVVNINQINKIYPIADRAYAISFNDCEGEVIMGRKGFESLCSRINWV